jgi:hypothetical protein
MRLVVLLEPFKDFEVRIKSYSGDPKYKIYRTIRPRKSFRVITLKKLKEHVKELQEKYPLYDYKLLKKKIKGNVYYILRRGSTSLNNPPIYFDLKHKKVYVPKTYVMRKRKLVNFVINMRLHALGVV